MGEGADHRHFAWSNAGTGKKSLTELYRALNGDGPAPYEWIISRVCEEFGCLPDVAEEALENDEGHRILTIISMRAFARTKNEWDAYVEAKRLNPKTKTEAPKGTMADLVKEIQFSLARGRMDPR